LNEAVHHSLKSFTSIRYQLALGKPSENIKDDITTLENTTPADANTPYLRPKTLNSRTAKHYYQAQSKILYKEATTIN